MKKGCKDLKQRIHISLYTLRKWLAGVVVTAMVIQPIGIWAEEVVEEEIAVDSVDVDTKINEDNVTQTSLKNPMWSKDSNGNDIVTWDCVYFGNFWQNDTNGDGSANRKDSKEPVKWRVLSVDGNKALLLSDKIIEGSKYNERMYNRDAYSVYWGNSDVRSYLNGYDKTYNDWKNDYSAVGFIDQAFSEGEKTSIVSSVLRTMVDGIQAETVDKVFLLSYEDIINNSYGFYSKCNKDPARVARITDFATDTLGVNYSGEEENWWMLREVKLGEHPSDDGDYGYWYSEIGLDGSMCEGFIPCDWEAPIRPALYLDITSSNYEYAGTVSSVGYRNAAATPSATATISPGPTSTPSINPTPSATATISPGPTSTPSINPTPTGNPTSAYDQSRDAWKFTNSASYFGNGEYEISPAFYDKLVKRCDNATESYIYSAKHKKWGGSCFGMAAASVLVYENIENIKSYSPDAASLGEADIYLNSNGDKDVGNIESFINYYYLSQLQQNVREYRDYYTSSNQWYLNYEKIINNSKGQRACVIGIDLYSNGHKVGGHAVTGYDFVESGDTYSFKVYDNSLGRDKIYNVSITKKSEKNYTVSCPEWEKDWGYSINIKYAISADKFNKVILNDNSAMVADDSYVILNTNYDNLAISDGKNTVKVIDGEVEEDNPLGIISYGNINEPANSEKVYEFKLPDTGVNYSVKCLDRTITDSEVTVKTDNFFTNIESGKPIKIEFTPDGLVNINSDEKVEQKIIYTNNLIISDNYETTVEGKIDNISLGGIMDGSVISSKDEQNVSVTTRGRDENSDSYDVELGSASYLAADTVGKIWLNTSEKISDKEYVINLAAKQKYQFKETIVGKPSIADKKVASINRKGLISAKKPGTTVITCGEIKITVNVYNPQFETKTYFASIGQKITPKYNDCNLKPTFYLQKNCSCATINPETGEVTATAKGTAKVTAEVGGRKVVTKIKIK